MKYFGTDGARGIAGSVLTAKMAYRIGRYLGGYDGKKKILLGRDTRLSGGMLVSALIAGIASSGSDVYNLAVTTTPSISYHVEHSKSLSYGIMVSASHNPFQDNGIKIFEKTGEKCRAELEEAIEAYIDSEEDYLPLKDHEELGRLYQNGKAYNEKTYIPWLAGHAPKAEGISLLLDLANGSTTAVAPDVFKLIGVKTKTIADVPDGMNINAGCGATHLENLEGEFKKGGYDLAFSYDGDGDRFMGVAPDGRLIDGDAAIYLLALYLRAEGKLKQNKVVITVMSNFGLRKALEEEGIGYEIVPVGDKYVQAKLKEAGLSLGGEQSGHVIVYDDLNTGDGILTSLYILKIYQEHPEIFAKLDNLKVYPQILVNIPFGDRATMEKILAGNKYLEAAKKAEKMLGSDGRLLVRTSGTESLIRVMGEHMDQAILKEAIDLVVATLEEEKQACAG